VRPGLRVNDIFTNNTIVVKFMETKWKVVGTSIFRLLTLKLVLATSHVFLLPKSSLNKHLALFVFAIRF